MDDSEEWTDAGALARHLPALTRLARALAIAPSDVDDVVQDTLAAGLERRRSGTETGVHWLKRTLRSRAIDLLRWRSVRHAAPSERQAAGALADDAQATHERLERHAALIASLLQLDESDRGLITLCYFDGLTPSQVAARMDVPASTVRTRVQRALQRLRRDLEARHGTSHWLTATAPISAEFRPQGWELLTSGSPLHSAGAVAMASKTPMIAAGSLAIVALLIAVQRPSLPGGRGGEWVEEGQATRLPPARAGLDAPAQIAPPGPKPSPPASSIAAQHRTHAAAPEVEATPAPVDRVAGRVLLLDGAPLDRVWVGIALAGSEFNGVFNHQITDENGRFAFRGLKPESFDLWVSSPFLRPETKGTGIDAGQTDLELRVDALCIDLQFEGEATIKPQGELVIDPVGATIGAKQRPRTMHGFEPPGASLVLPAGTGFAISWLSEDEQGRRFGVVPARLGSGHYDIPMRRRHPEFGALELDVSGTSLPSDVQVTARLVPLGAKSRPSSRRQEIRFPSSEVPVRREGIYPATYRITPRVSGPPETVGLIQIRAAVDEISITPGALTNADLIVSMGGGVQITVNVARGPSEPRTYRPFYELDAFHEASGKWQRLATARRSEQDKPIFTSAFPDGVTVHTAKPIPPGRCRLRIRSGDWESGVIEVAIEAGSFTPVDFVGMR